MQSDQQEQINEIIEYINNTSVYTLKKVDDCYQKTQQYINKNMNSKSYQELYRKNAQFIRQEGDKNNSKACYMLGIMYNYGYGIQKNSVLSLVWLKKAHQLGQIHSIFDIYTIEKDPQRKQLLLKQGVQKQCVRALYKFGRNLMRGQDGQTKNLQLGKQYMKMASKKGFSKASYKYGVYLYNQSFYFEAIEYLKLSLEANPEMFKDSQTNIGRCFYQLRNYEQSKKWLSGKYNGESIRAKMYLADVYEKTGQVSEQKKKYQELINSEGVDRVSLGRLYFDFALLMKKEKKDQEFLKYLQIGVKLGNQESQALIAMMY